MVHRATGATWGEFDEFRCICWSVWLCLPQVAIMAPDMASFQTVEEAAVYNQEEVHPVTLFATSNGTHIAVQVGWVTSWAVKHTSVSSCCLRPKTVLWASFGPVNLISYRCVTDLILLHFCSLQLSPIPVCVGSILGGVSVIKGLKYSCDSLRGYHPVKLFTLNFNR